MIEITENQFSAYTFFTRNPVVSAFGKEVHWFKNGDNMLFGVIRFDYSDKDYISLVLCRDDKRQIRCINIQDGFLDVSEAKRWLFAASDSFELTDEYSQLKKTYEDHYNDVFLPKGKKKDKNEDGYFRILRDKRTHIAAKLLISEIMPYFFDVDKNFIEQFQTTGFDARLWELYLFCYFNEEGLKINREHNAPDFYLSNGDIDIGLEAVICGRSSNEDNKQVLNPDILREKMKAMPAKFSNTLYSKLSHKNSGERYWEFSHTKGKPFVIAIADFHEDQSMLWSGSSLQICLYGYQYKHDFDDNGKLIVIPEKVKLCKENGSEIPAFFFQENAENVSAVIHSSSGTVSKFNRIGKQCGFGSNEVIMLRKGTFYNPNANASEPLIFEYIVNEDNSETWSEGISIYHNPNAKYPLPEDFFPNATHNWLIGEYITSDMPNCHVYSSFTHLITKVP